MKVDCTDFIININHEFVLQYDFTRGYEIMPKNDTQSGAVVRPPSDGSELIPAEVQRNLRNNDTISSDKPVTDGYTVDDEGIINNHAIEPDEYSAEYPAPYQQRRYLVQGAIAVVFIAFIIWVAFVAS